MLVFTFIIYHGRTPRRRVELRRCAHRRCRASRFALQRYFHFLFSSAIRYFPNEFGSSDGIYAVMRDAIRFTGSRATATLGMTRAWLAARAASAFARRAAHDAISRLSRYIGRLWFQHHRLFIALSASPPCRAHRFVD